MPPKKGNPPAVAVPETGKPVMPPRKGKRISGATAAGGFKPPMMKGK